MHISKYQLPLPNNLTKCSKMTEEGHQLNGMNGNADGKIKEECSKGSNRQGGRLKFFKDGKFILELERAQEGERVSWIPVPRKTFWPPQGTVSSTPIYRQETCTSFSDDNSSIQSSPWQRDHTWKQTSPSRNVSKEMTFFFWRPKGKRLFPRSMKCRTPYSTAPDGRCNNQSFAKVKKETKRTMMAIVQFLIEKNHRSSTSPRSETAVSPRKRFLREMEKDKFENPIPLEDYASGHGSCLKRSRSKTLQQTHSYNRPQSTPSLPQLLPSNVAQPVPTNGEVRPPRNCSYSITSLLAEERPCSPGSSPGQYSAVATETQQHHAPSQDDWWYSDSVNRLRSIELSQAEKHHPNYPPYLHRAHVSPSSYLGGPYLYNMPTSPAGPPFLYNARGYVSPAIYQHRQDISRHEEWSVGTRPYVDEGRSKEDTPSDMPLNLSKHSG